MYKYDAISTCSMLALCSGLQSIVEWGRESARDPLSWFTILLVTAAVVRMCITGFDPIKEAKEIVKAWWAPVVREGDLLGLNGAPARAPTWSLISFFLSLGLITNILGRLRFRAGDAPEQVPPEPVQVPVAESAPAVVLAPVYRDYLTGPVFGEPWWAAH